VIETEASTLILIFEVSYSVYLDLRILYAIENQLVFFSICSFTFYFNGVLFMNDSFTI
jgi:hypothetical protein